MFKRNINVFKKNCAIILGNVIAIRILSSQELDFKSTFRKLLFREAGGSLLVEAGVSLLAEAGGSLLAEAGGLLLSEAGGSFIYFWREVGEH